MNERGIRRWALLGVLASAALLAPACEREFPQTGSDFEGRANEAQDLESFVDEEQGQPATGGSGLQQQQQQQREVDPRIGAPGDIEPRELPQTDQGFEVPPPDQYQNLEPNYRRGEEGGEAPPSK